MERSINYPIPCLSKLSFEIWWAFHPDKFLIYIAKSEGLFELINSKIRPKNELEVFHFFPNRAFIWYWVSIFGKGLPLFILYDIQFPSCEQREYLGPLNETSTLINLPFHCQVQDYLRIFLRLSLFSYIT